MCVADLVYIDRAVCTICNAELGIGEKFYAAFPECKESRSVPPDVTSRAKEFAEQYRSRCVMLTGRDGESVAALCMKHASDLAYTILTEVGRCSESDKPSAS